MWLIVPLIYFLGWWQTGSLRQAFNGTIAWILGYAVAAGSILALDVGGYDFVRATPDSPGAALAILGGFIGMWISNIIWRSRGGDPVREPGKWERSFRAMMGKEKPKKRKRPAPSPQRQVQSPQYHQVPQSSQQTSGPAPVDAQYRPAGAASAGQQVYRAQPQPQQSPAHGGAAQQRVGPPNTSPHPQRPEQGQTQRKKRDQRNSPTADRYAKATGRALGAMFRGPSKKKR